MKLIRVSIALFKEINQMIKDQEPMSKSMACFNLLVVGQSSLAVPTFY